MSMTRSGRSGTGTGTAVAASAAGAGGGVLGPTAGGSAPDDASGAAQESAFTALFYRRPRGTGPQRDRRRTLPGLRARDRPLS